jgi:hypothetical protein
MSEPFLEEQLRRIRQMSARITEARSRQHELSESMVRDREQRHFSPADDVRDRRALPRGEQHEQEHDHAEDRPVRRRSAAARRRR